MDMSLVSGGFSAVSGLISASYSNKAEKARAGAANQIRAGNNSVVAAVNERNGAITALQRWRQGVANSRVYEAVAANQDALAINFNRARDARTRSNFATNIRNAEEIGRQQAAAAVSGVTGSVVDVINMTSRLKQNIERQAVLDTEQQVDYDFKRKETAVRLSTMDSLDFSLIFDNTVQKDYGQNTAKTQSVFGAMISGKDTLKNLTQGIADFKFNKPSSSKFDPTWEDL